MLAWMVKSPVNPSTLTAATYWPQFKLAVSDSTISPLLNTEIVAEVPKLSLSHPGIF